MKLLNRLPLGRKPAPEPEPPRSRSAVLQDMIVERLRLRRAQALYADLLSLEEYWPVLIPLLVWFGWRTYKRERRAVLARKAARGSES